MQPMVYCIWEGRAQKDDRGFSLGAGSPPYNPKQLQVVPVDADKESNEEEDAAAQGATDEVAVPSNHPKIHDEIFI